MPLDGTVVHGLVHELSRLLVNGRVDKITQPEVDEVHIAIRAGGVNHRLLLTANATAPRLHLTQITKEAPLQAPHFCMVLRKHLSGGRITAMTQPQFERMVMIEIENRTEMGDTARKLLIIEMMGKHSNIILTDHEEKVLDAIKHVPLSMSAVRYILPGAKYNMPPARGKVSPLQKTLDEVFDVEKLADTTLAKALFQLYNGISPLLATELCARALLHPETQVNALTATEKQALASAFETYKTTLTNGEFTPQICFNEEGRALDFTPWAFLQYAPLRAVAYDSFSQMIGEFYAKRDAYYRLSQRTTDLRKVVTTLIERGRKKAFAHEKSLAETLTRDALRIKGELLTAYLHKVERGASSLEVENFYDNNNPITITLDPTLTPSENAQRYFRQYNKQKRANIALTEQIAENAHNLNYLETVSAALDNAQNEVDVNEIRAELETEGFVKRRITSGHKKMQKQRPAKPLHHETPDGFDIYVGKNNTQNDQLTLRTAHATDLWFHTKDIPGSHVILITRGAEPSEEAVLQAASLAAYHSKARESSNVPVDYVMRKHVRKPAGAKPGFVIYDYHKTVYVTPHETGNP